MQLTFKNKHIYFALSQCWDQLPLAFKYQIQQAVTANQDDEADQSVTLTPSILMTIYKVVAGMPEGIAAAPNKSMKEQLVPQLMFQAVSRANAAAQEIPNLSVNEGYANAMAAISQAIEGVITTQDIPQLVGKIVDALNVINANQSALIGDPQCLDFLGLLESAKEVFQAITAIQEIDARDQANRQALIEDSKQRILTA